MSIRFWVVPSKSRPYSSPPPCFVLEQDNWNDYGFRTQYHLTYRGHDKSGKTEETSIGPVKILRKGQTEDDPLQLSVEFSSLSGDYCSVGQSLDYYERLNKIGDAGRVALDGLRDVVSHPELVEEFESEEGWSTSLFRYQTEGPAAFLNLARGLTNGDYSKAPGLHPSFSFRPTGWLNSLELTSTSGGPSAGYPATSILPERVNILVGRNGSGKSTFLARLARVAYASPNMRTLRPLRDIGELTPMGLGFPRIITVAFSPFDTFLFPTSDDRTREQVRKELQSGTGRFTFIGLRDMAEEEQAENTPALLRNVPEDELESRLTLEHRLQTRLKSSEKLEKEFTEFIAKINKSEKRLKALRYALQKIGGEVFSASRIPLAGHIDEVTSRVWFSSRSTGHKVSLLVVFGLAANLEPTSLVLIDEPETHLHPPLLAGMMHALRELLQQWESTAVVATHSPIVVQESLAKHVHVVVREDDVGASRAVESETFGESVGVITSQVFGLVHDATDFHNVLDTLVERYQSMDAIESFFKDGELSHQARAYVLGRLAQRPQG